MGPATLDATRARCPVGVYLRGVGVCFDVSEARATRPGEVLKPGALADKVGLSDREAGKVPGRSRVAPNVFRRLSGAGGLTAVGESH